MRLKKKFSCGINAILPVQSCLKKYFPSRFPQITSIFRAIPSHSEGRFAIVTDVGTGCGGRGGGARRAALTGLPKNFGGTGTRAAECFCGRLSRTAKSWGPDPRCWCQVGGG